MTTDVQQKLYFAKVNAALLRPDGKNREHVNFMVWLHLVEAAAFMAYPNAHEARNLFCSRAGLYNSNKESSP